MDRSNCFRSGIDYPQPHTKLWKDNNGRKKGESEKE